jgi:hypothetical protein
MLDLDEIDGVHGNGHFMAVLDGPHPSLARFLSKDAGMTPSIPR